MDGRDRSSVYPMNIGCRTDHNDLGKQIKADALAFA
jgi:hypothetical protein